MCSRFHSSLAACVLAACSASAAPRILRVCADPGNLPFSNQREEGLENHLAERIASHLSATVAYTWMPQRKSFIRDSLDAGTCDVLMGIPAGMDGVATTRPYYRSTYVLVSREPVASLDDPRLKTWKIGVHIVGDDFAPPASLLARRGLAGNLAGYSLFNDKGEENPAALIHAVARREVNVAAIWGPFAGYYASRESVPLHIQTLPDYGAAAPLSYAISIGVRPGDQALRAELDRELGHQCDAVRSLLAEYGIPQVHVDGEKEACDSPQPSSALLH